MEKELEKINYGFMEKLNKLLNSELIKLKDLLQNKDTFNFPAVYIFSKPNSKEVVYVGRTKTLYLWERIKDHKTINTKSDLNIMIKGKENYPQIVDEYMIRCLKIEDGRERMFFENFVIAILQPELNKHG